MGKAEQNQGDSLDGFTADLADAVMLDHFANPLADPNAILGRATTRLIYDAFAYHRTRDLPNPQPTVVYALARETHDSDLPANTVSRIQHSFVYSDGFGREIQKKFQAEPETINNAPGPPRWVGSGWTIYNNKGKPVRQFESFFSATHRFEFGTAAGVSPIVFYDPLDRVVAIVHPNQTYEKLLFDPWRQVVWDVNDTVANDPRTDADIRGFTEDYFASLPAAPPWQTWRTQRQGGALGVEEQAAAAKANEHRDTPTTIYLDTLARPFLTLTDNGPDPAQPAQHRLFAKRAEWDIEGNQRVIRDAIVQADDARGRIVMRYDYDLLGNRIRQLSMESGARWMLNDASGRPFRSWDSRGQQFRSDYDPLRRPLRTLVTGADPDVHRRADQRQRQQGVPRRDARGALGRLRRDRPRPDPRRRAPARPVHRLRRPRRRRRHERGGHAVRHRVDAADRARLDRARGHRGRAGAARRARVVNSVNYEDGDGPDSRMARIMPVVTRARRRRHRADHRRGGPGPHRGLEGPGRQPADRRPHRQLGDAGRATSSSTA